MEDRRVNLLNKGHVRLIRWMGDDWTPESTARISTGLEEAERTDNQRIALTRYLMRHWHTTPFEFVQADFEIKAPIMVIREWQRHRTQCLTGDTELYFDLPLRKSSRKNRRIYKKKLSELANRWHADTSVKRPDKQKRSKRDYNRKLIGQMQLRCANEDTKEVINTNITNIINTGINDIYEVELINGFKIRSTLNHRYLTDAGWQTLGNAFDIQHSINNYKNITWRDTCKVGVNGQLCWKNKNWLQKQREKGLQVSEITNNAGCSYHTIRKWLKIHGLQYSAKEKVAFSAKTQKGQKRSSPNFRKPWSKEKCEAVSKARSGSNSNFWKGGITPERQNIGRWTREQASRVHKQYNYTCALTGQAGGKLVVHHIDPVWHNPKRAKDLTNLCSLSEKAHRWLHKNHLDLVFLEYFQSGQDLSKFMELYKDVKFKCQHPTTTGRRLSIHFVGIKSIKYIGQQQTYDVSVEGPYHNFVANGIIVHNSYNEQSGRYQQLEPDYYMPSRERIAKQSKTNKQGTGEEGFSESQKDEFFRHWTQQQWDFEYAYCKDLEVNMAKELARINMPISHYSTMRVTANLLNWFRFLRLRNSSFAQYEICVYAQAIQKILKELFPECIRAFEDYWQNSVSFSSKEIEFVKRMLLGDRPFMNEGEVEFDAHWTKREHDEFIKKIEGIEFGYLLSQNA